MSNILVTGATGNTGSLLIPKLVQAGHRVRAFVRDGEKAQALKQAGAEIYFGDLDQPDTIAGALEDMDTIYLCLWNGPNAEKQGKAVMEAIKQAGTKPFIVRHSAYGSPDSRIIRQINAVDDVIKASGLRWVSIKPTFYMQNLMMAAQSIQQGGAIYWDWADGSAGMVDVRDVVDSAFGALTGKATDGTEYVLTGPASISMQDVANAFSNVLDSPVSYVPVPHSASREAMLGMGVHEFIVEGYMELNEGFSKGYADLKTNNVALLAGHEPRAFDGFVRDFRAYFVPSEVHA